MTPKKQKTLVSFKVDAKSNNNNNSCKMNVKVIRSKSKNKIMCIEVEEDFIDFIFRFLTNLSVPF